MQFDAPALLADHHIRFERGSGRGGRWLDVSCPFCGDVSHKGGSKMYGGFNLDNGRWHCWRCGGKRQEVALAQILTITQEQAKELIWKYLGPSGAGSSPVVDPNGVARPRFIEPPGGALLPVHKKYLQARGFDPDELVREWGIRGAGPKTFWQERVYSDRIIIPVRDKAMRCVTFQGRDITGTSKAKYKACPDELSAIPIKHTLYGLEKTRPDRICVLEGAVDVWRMGAGFVANLGTSMTKEQLQILAKWPTIMFLFDAEPEAMEKARRYASDLAGLGKNVELIQSSFGAGRDCGDLTATEAAGLRADLGF